MSRRGMASRSEDFQLCLQKVCNYHKIYAQKGNFEFCSSSFETDSGAFPNTLGQS